MSGREDILIAGAGPWGLATAWRLAAGGAQVAVLDDGRPPAAQVAAGMLGPWSEYDPREADLHPPMVAAAHRWPRFAADLTAASGRDCGHRPGGALLVAGRPEQVAQVRTQMRWLAEVGTTPPWIAGSQIRQYEPGLGPAAVGGVHLPDEGQVEPRALMAALREACHRAGVTLVSGRARAIHRRQGVVAGLELTEGPPRLAGQVVLAAGAGLGAVAGAGRVRPVKGQILRLSCPETPPLAGTVRSPSVYLAARDREVVVGATTEERSDPVPTAEGIHRLLDEALHLVPELGDLPLAEVAAGVRPATGDGRPLVGRDHHGLVWATGGYRHGLLLTPLASTAAYAAVVGTDPPPHTAQWRPEPEG